MKSFRILLSLLVIVAAVLFTLRHQSLRQLRSEGEQLRQLEGELAPVAAADADAPQTAVTTTNAALSGAERLELLRLRGEVARLRNEARENLKPTQTAETASSPSAPSPDETQAFPSNHLVTATATVGSGQTFAVGGWPGAPGTRVFLLITPHVLERTPQGAPVRISSRLVAVPEAGVPEAFLSNSQGAPQQESPVLTGPELEWLQNKLGSEGTNIISFPEVLTPDGQGATLSIGSLVFNADSTSRNAVTTFRVLPRVAQDGQTVSVQLSLEHSSDAPATVGSDDNFQSWDAQHIIPTRPTGQ